MTRLLSRLHPSPEVGSVLIAATAAVVLLMLTTQTGDADYVQSLAPAAMAVLAGFLMATRRTALALAVLALYLGVADGYLRLSTGSQYATLGRDVLLGSISFGAAVRATQPGASITWPRWSALVAAYVLWCVAQVFNPENDSVGRAVATLRPHLLWVPLFFLGWAFMRDRANLRALCGVLLVVAAVNGVVSFVQFQLTPEQLATWGPGYAERLQGTGDVSQRIFVDESGNARTRPFGLGADFGFSGAVSLLAIPCGLAFFTVGFRRILHLVATIPLLGLSVVGLVTSQARVAVVGIFLVLLAYLMLAGLSRRTLRTIVVMTVAAGIAAFAIGQLTKTAEEGAFDRYTSISPANVFETAYDYRVDSMNLLPTYIVDYPLGAGLGTTGPGASFNTADVENRGLNGETQFNFLVVELGIPGLLLMCALLAAFVIAAFRALPHLPDFEARTYLSALAAPICATPIFWIFGTNTAGVPGGPYFWLIGGVLAWYGSEHIKDRPG